MVSAQDILAAGRNQIVHLQGSLSQAASRVSPPDACGPDSLVFASKKEQVEQAQKRGARLFILSPGLPVPPEGTSLSCKKINSAMALVLPLFDQKSERFGLRGKIHPTAVISPSAKIAEGVTILPYAVIGDEVVIARGTVIGAHTVLEPRATVGEDCILHAHVFIGYGCVIGNRVEIHPHSTIGADGYGYATDEEHKHHKIAQIGIVRIEDDVEIGSQVTIDRATLTETRIGRGSKLDNLIHIAHNCTVGENTLIAAAFKTAGSTKIGSRCMIAGDVSVSDHINIADDTVLVGHSCVRSNINSPGTYGGDPVRPLPDFLKTLNTLPLLPKLRKDVARILRHMGLEKE